MPLGIVPNGHTNTITAPTWAKVSVLLLLSQVSSGCNTILMKPSDGTALPVVPPPASGNITGSSSPTSEVEVVSKSEEAPVPNYPEGTMLLPIALEDGTPIGLEYADGTVTFFIGDTRADLLSITAYDNMYFADDEVPMIGKEPTQMIKGVDANSNGDVRLHGSLGSIALEHDSLENGMQTAEVCYDGDGGTIEITGIPYTIDPNHLADPFIYAADKAGLPPLQTTGTLSMILGVTEQ